MSRSASMVRLRTHPVDLRAHGRGRLVGIAAMLVAAALLPLCCAAESGAIPPPVRAGVTDTFYGTPVNDDFRHLEQVTDPDVTAWMHAESDRARSTLDGLPGRGQVLADIEEIENGAPTRIFSVERLPGERYLYLKRIPNDNGVRLYKRYGAKGPERLLVDLDPWVERTGHSHAFSYFSSSPGGRHLAYGLSEGGDEAATLRVLRTDNLEDLIAPIDRTDLNSGESGDTGIGWLPDGNGFFFNRLTPGSGPDQPRAERYQWSQVFLRRIGQPDFERLRVFGGPDMRDVALKAADVPLVFVPPLEQFALALVVHGTQREFSMYKADLAAVLAGNAQWRQVLKPDAGVVGMSMHEDELYFLTNKNAPRFKVMRTSLSRPDFDSATLVYAPERGIVATIAAAKDGLYLKVRSGMISRLLRIAYRPGAKPTEVPLPEAGTFEMINPGTRIAGVLIRLEGWNRAFQYWRYDPRRGRFINDGLQPRGPFDLPDDIEAIETDVRSHDGTMVPMSIVRRKGLAQDGRNPTLLQGYAAYGSTDEPAFDPAQLAWLRRGGINATCHARGGGVYGDDWFKAGRGPTKPNTWKDGIACAEYLISAGYTSPAKLAIYGGSAGGIFAGRVITERPELFAAAVIQVGALDMVRSEKTAIGSQNVPEFGTVNDEAGFRALLAMSAYHHVENGRKYPATLFIHGVNDARVDVWHSLKMAARLRAARPDGNLTLLRLDYDAGHGSGSSRAQHQQELADLWSFIFWQTGDPEFQPAP
ncbi:MAG: prolyl oligopeptidase family serine peptidase [Betaproteobacteria bacterium]